VAEGFTGGYSGQGFTLRGDKGRFTLPPAFRKAVAQSSDDKILCLDKHERWNCLTGFGLSRRSELMAQIDREEEIALNRDRDFDRDTRQSQLFGFSRIPFDASGRFVMPDHLVQLGKLKDGVYFHGAGSFFTLWNPAELYKMDDAWAAAKAACRMLVSEGGGE
jgi:MraZ protein